MLLISMSQLQNVKISVQEVYFIDFSTKFLLLQVTASKAKHRLQLLVKSEYGGPTKCTVLKLNQSINQSTLLVHPSKMNNRNIKQTFENDKTLPYYFKNIKHA